MTSPSEGARLQALLLDLLAMPCVTGDEGPIADWVQDRYAASEPVRRIGHSLVVGAGDPGRPTVLLVGHLDVVPPTEADLDPRVEADRVLGRGASDMKSGLAVGMDCFEDPALRDGPCNLLLVAYAGEEGPHEGNELAGVLADVREVAAADLAIVLEPTDLEVQLGCLGAVHADVEFTGRAAHSARPWHGENALTKAGAFLAMLHDRKPAPVEIDGMVYREVFTATQARTRNARNVVPDSFVVNLNYRYAPSRTVEEAESVLRDLVGGHAQVTITDRAPAAAPRRDDPLVQQFLAAADAPVEPKQAWTDVARFAEVGVPAVNYGPGLTAQAHQAGEYVPVSNLEVARAAVARFLRTARTGERGRES